MLERASVYVLYVNSDGRISARPAAFPAKCPVERLFDQRELNPSAALDPAEE